MSCFPFNVRVYGILINEQNEVLTTNESFRGQMITKFPGGGLQFGEGPEECVRREVMEELELEVIVLKHFYTTGFFQASAFNPNDQLISIYYLIEPSGELDLPADPPDEHLPETVAHLVSYRWVSLKEITPGMFTFPVDQKVADLLINKAP